MSAEVVAKKFYNAATAQQAFGVALSEHIGMLSDKQPAHIQPPNGRGALFCNGCACFLEVAAVAIKGRGILTTMGWGICVNEDSPRAGFVTIAYKGCEDHRKR